jgi:hypothetical protein
VELIIALLVVGSSLWMVIDSSNLGAHRSRVPGIASTHPIGWFLAGLLVWIVVFPTYLITRPKMLAASGGQQGGRMPVAPATPGSGPVWGGPVAASAAVPAGWSATPPVSPTPPLPTIEAGWHRDPSGRHEVRWWDGQRWTEHVATQGQPSTDAL